MCMNSTWEEEQEDAGWQGQGQTHRVGCGSAAQHLLHVCKVSLHVSLVFSFFSVRNQTQGLVIARQGLYHGTTPPAPGSPFPDSSGSCSLSSSIIRVLSYVFCVSLLLTIFPSPQEKTMTESVLSLVMLLYLCELFLCLG